MHEHTLPADFFFGAAMSGPQTEGGWRVGGKLENLWDTWSNESIDSFHNRVGSYVGNDFMNRYEQDLDIMASLGLTSFRTSIQWSRLLDADGALNPAGTAWYHRLIAAAHARNLDVFMNLYHFDLPTHLFRRGGWENREVVESFANYAEVAFREFGDEIGCWFTFNEPIVEPEQRYMSGAWYPQVRDFARSLAVRYHISLAHCLAVERFRAAQAAGVARADARIGLINCFSPSYTRDDPSPADLEARRMSDGLGNRWWLDLVTRGELPADVLDTLEQRGVRAPMRPGDEAILALGRVDWLGCNYYQPARVQAPARAVDDLGNPRFADSYAWPEARMNTSRGWEIYPKGIYDFGMSLKRDYPGLEFFISENGMGIEGEAARRGADGRIDDGYRIEFVRDHLAWIARAIDEGAACRGYHYWALIDNWSWANAFKNRYGFVEVDLDNGYERRLKRSAEWLKEVVATRIVR